MLKCRPGGVGCLSLVSVAAIKHHDQSSLGREAFIWLMCLDCRLLREAEEGTKVKVMEECCLLSLICIL